MAGGAWKVAYADFVTAMMAFFMVLWILGTEQEMLDQLQEYFRNPPSPWEREANKFMVESGDFQGMSDSLNADEDFFNADQADVLQGIRDSFTELIQQNELIDSPPIDIDLIGDELRLTLYNQDEMSLFKGDTTGLSQWGEFIIMNIAWILTRHDLEVTIESDIGNDYRVKKPTYGPFELTSDRSNRVRRGLEHFAKGAVDVKRVVGYGSARPLEGGESGIKRHDRTVISLSMPEQMETEDYEKKRAIEQQMQNNQKSVDLLRED
jgi:chemotaxis protein MotB